MILVVPLCLLCSVAGVLSTHGSVNIFVQIGLVVLVGLACKNAILDRRVRQGACTREGRPRFEATRGGLAAAAAADPDDLASPSSWAWSPWSSPAGPGRRCAARWERPSSAACSA